MSITWETFAHVVDKLFPDPFLKNQNWACLWTNNLKFYAVCFYGISSRRLSKCIETKLQTTCIYLISYKAFLKKQRGLVLVSLTHFLYDFWRKMFLLLYSITWVNFIVRLPLFLQILGYVFIVIVNQVLTA